VDEYDHQRRLPGNSFSAPMVIKVWKSFECVEDKDSSDSKRIAWRFGRIPKIFGGDGRSAVVLHLLLHAGHYFVTDVIDPEVDVPKVINYASCRSCGRWIDTTKGVSWKHLERCYRCICNSATLIGSGHKRLCKGLTPKSVRKGWKPIRIYDSDLNDKAWDSEVHFADFECFVDPDGGRQHVVYAAALHSTNAEKPLAWYGKNALDDFMEFVLTLKGVLYFYNGSGYDLFFIMNWMVRNKAHVLKKGFVKKGSRIMAMNLRTRPVTLTVRDLFLFTHCSLARACGDWGVQDSLSKTSFDHERVRSWSDVEEVKAEVLPYVKQDVVALRALYMKIAGHQWEVFGQNLTKYMSLSHLTYGIWTAKNNKMCKLIYLPDAVEDEWMRKAYYGGRCQPQSKGFMASGFEEMYDHYIETGELKLEMLKNPGDFLQYIDVVSLYPHVMRDKLYPCGSFKFYQVRTEKRGGPMTTWEKSLINSLKVAPNETQARRIYKVDVQCPLDILTPFLFNRDSDGKLVQDLLPKIGATYTGPELVHAISLGYEVTRIYEFFEFEMLKPLFKAYILLLFEMKKAAKKGTQAYATAKLLMNSLSGKMGQKMILSNWFCCTTAQFPADNAMLLDWEPILDEDNNCVAFMYEEEKHNPTPQYPVYLAAFILGYSRIHMSEALVACGGYRKPKRAMYYTDTDSFVLHAEAVKILEETTNMIGHELGQLDDELEGGKVVAAVFLAPKTYILVYVDKEQKKLMSVVRCKGIPHMSMPFDCRDDTKVVDEYLKKIGMLDETNKIPDHYVDLRKKVYTVTPVDETKEPTMHSHLTYDMFLQMLTEDAVVSCTFGTLKRNWTATTLAGGMAIVPMVQRRKVQNLPFWKRTTRFFLNPVEDFMSLPLGMFLCVGCILLTCFRCLWM
jgi:hypothetical protein